MGESNLLGPTVNVHAKVATPVHWRWEKSVARVHEVAVHAQSAICLSTQELLTITHEMGVWVQQPDDSGVANIAPSPCHECTVQVGLRAHQQVICNHAPEERTNARMF